MKTANALKNAINPNNLGYSKVHTNLFDDGKTYEYFKLESDGYVYVLCIDTNRCTRYNGEGQNGKRIGMEAYLTARETLESEAAFKDIMEQVEEDTTTEEIKEIQDMYCRHPEGSDLEVPATINEHGCVDCSKCNVQNCVHRDCMRRNPTSEGGLAECPRLKVKAEEPKQPKAKKTRKSKDIAYEGNGATLTAKQVDFLHEMVDTVAWDGFDHPLYVDLLVDEIGGQFAGKPMTVGAMISTLCEKGLGERETTRRDNHKCTSFCLTEMGQAVAIDLGL